MIGRYTVSPAFPFTVPTSKLTPPVCPLGGVVVVVAVVAAVVPTVPPAPTVIVPST